MKRIERIFLAVAAVALVPGALLTRGQIRSGPLVPVGKAIVGATLKPGQYPAGLGTGTTVEVIEAPPATSGATNSATSHGEATVLALEAATDASGTVQVSLVVPRAVSSLVATAGAAGRISLVVVGQ